MIIWALGGDQPPIVDVLTRPEVLQAFGGVVVLMLGAIGSLFAYLKVKLDRLGSKTEIAKNAAIGAHDQVANTHTVNLRDDLDSFRDEMRDGFKRMDRAFGEVNDRQVQEQHDRAAIDQRVIEMERRATEEHARIWRSLEDHS